jgi:hypothetical protein
VLVVRRRGRGKTSGRRRESRRGRARRESGMDAMVREARNRSAQEGGGRRAKRSSCSLCRRKMREDGQHSFYSTRSVPSLRRQDLLDPCLHIPLLVVSERMRHSYHPSSVTVLFAREEDETHLGTC